MKNYLASILCLLIMASTAHAQGIKPGETCPDIEFKNVYNTDKPSLRMSDLRGKGVILAFWSSGCKSSMASLALVKTLQERFKDQLQFIAINKQSKDSTARLYKRFPDLVRPSVPFISGDTALRSVFPHDAYPFHVWIDQRGVVRYLTSSHNLDAENIESFLQGRSLPIINKEYFNDTEPTKPLLAKAGGRWLDKVPFYSYIARCVDGPEIGHTYGSEAKDGVHYSQECASIKELLQFAFEEGGKYRFTLKNTMVMQVKDSLAFIRPDDPKKLDHWRRDHAWSYDLLLPVDRKSEAYNITQHDLVRFFNLDVSIEKRKISSWVLVRTGKEDMLASKGGTPYSDLLSAKADTCYTVRNMPMNILVANLQWRAYWNKDDLPLIDATGISGNIDIRLPADAFRLFNVERLRPALRSYGLDIILRKWENPVLIVKEKE